MAPTKTLLLIALLAAAATTTTCALDAESNNYSILSKLFNSPQQQQVATPQKKRGLFGRKKNNVSPKPKEGEGEQTYSAYLTAALSIFLAIGTWYLPIGGSNSDDKQKIIINNKKLSMDYNSTCTESISDLETTIDSSSSDDDDSDDNETQQKRRQLLVNKPPSGYGNFLSFISEDSPVVEPNEAEKKITQVNEIKELMIDNEISNEKCNELFKLYDNKLDSLYKNLVRLKEKKNEQ